MKDLCLSPEDYDFAPEKLLPAALSGMRHSIRPRRTVIEKAQRRAFDGAYAEMAAGDGSEEQAKADIRHDWAPRVPTRITTAIVPSRDTAYPNGSDAPQWDDLPVVEAGPRRARALAMPVVDSSRDSDTVRAFDMLRTRLRQVTRENGWRNIAVAAPTSGCGNTFTAVNLALSLSRVPGSRTVLMDMNLHRPGVAKAFDLAAPGPMRDYLGGTTAMSDHLVRLGDTLTLGLNAEPCEDASDVIQNPSSALTLDRMRAALRPELVIYDMPAMLAHDDLSAFLPQLDGVLLVSDGTRTMGRQLKECERMLDGQVPLLGVVLNRARRNSIPRYR